MCKYLLRDGSWLPKQHYFKSLEQQFPNFVCDLKLANGVCTAYWIWQVKLKLQPWFVSWPEVGNHWSRVSPLAPQMDIIQVMTKNYGTFVERYWPCERSATAAWGTTEPDTFQLIQITGKTPNLTSQRTHCTRHALSTVLFIRSIKRSAQLHCVGTVRRLLVLKDMVRIVTTVL